MKAALGFFENLSIRKQLLIGVTAALVLITIALTAVAYLVMAAALEREFMDRLRVGAESTLAAREIVKQKVLVYSDLLAKRRGLAWAVANQEEAVLTEILVAEYQQIHAWDDTVKTIEVTDARGVVIMRGHNPGKKGDDKSRVGMIQGALAGNVTGGLITSPTTGEMAFDAVNPLWHEGQVVGTLKVGSYLKDDTARYIKGIANVEVIFFSGDQVNVSTIEGAADLTLPAGFRSSLKPGAATYQEWLINGQAHSGFFIPCVNPQGEAQGVMAGFLSRAPLEQASTTLLFRLVLAAILAMVLILFPALVGLKLITGEIGNITGVFERIATGDLTVTVDYESDNEVGKLAASARAMLAQFNEIIGAIHRNAEELVQAVGVLASASKETLAGTDEQSEQAAAVASAAVQMKQAIADISATIDRDMAVVKEATAAVHSIKKITEILATIKGVANQINLLALNAAVEAARAGEHGQGFAVVADEVRNLSKRTRAATDQIEVVMEEFSSFDQQMKRLEDSSRGIGSAVGQQNAAAEEINRSIGEVEKVAERTATLSLNTDEQVAVLQGIAERLRESVAGIQVLS